MQKSLVLVFALVSITPLTMWSQSKPAEVAALPITEIPAAPGSTLALFWSGDGGWAELVDSIAHELAHADVAVIGVNSHTWLGRKPRTPQEAARDAERMLRYYLAHWNRSRIMLVGFSRGADFIPFIVNRLPADLQQRVVVAGLLGAERTASFEFHLSDLIRSSARATDLPSRAEIERSATVHYVCMYGTKDENSVCPDLDKSRVTVIARVGDHHLDRNYAAIARDLLAGAGARGVGASKP